MDKVELYRKIEPNPDGIVTATLDDVLPVIRDQQAEDDVRLAQVVRKFLGSPTSRSLQRHANDLHDAGFTHDCSMFLAILDALRVELRLGDAREKPNANQTNPSG